MLCSCRERRWKRQASVAFIPYEEDRPLQCADEPSTGLAHILGFYTPIGPTTGNIRGATYPNHPADRYTVHAKAKPNLYYKIRLAGTSTSKIKLSDVVVTLIKTHSDKQYH